MEEAPSPNSLSSATRGGLPEVPRTDREKQEYLATLTFEILDEDFIDWSRLEAEVVRLMTDYTVDTLAALGRLPRGDAIQHLSDSLQDKTHVEGLVKAASLLIGHSSQSLGTTEGLIRLTKTALEETATDEVASARLAEALVLKGLLRMVGPDETTASLRDKLRGVLVGLECNKRKNRRGDTFQDRVGDELGNIEEALGQQGIPIRLLNESEMKGRVQDKDFDYGFELEGAIIIGIETNYYTGGGSKISEIVRSYDQLAHKLLDRDIEFMWVSDGQGAKALRDVPHVYNLHQVRTRLERYIRLTAQSRMDSNSAPPV
jgi:hypothetical protein